MARGIFILINLRVFLVLALLFSATFGNEYIFWARMQTKDFALSSSEINLVPAMSYTKNPKIKRVCKLYFKHNVILPNSTQKLALLNSKKDELFDCFLQNGANISTWSESINLSLTEQSELTLPAVRFVAEFKADYVIIYLILR